MKDKSTKQKELDAKRFFKKHNKKEGTQRVYPRETPTI